MESEHFDHLVSTLGTAGTRRRLLRRLSAIPLAGGLAAFPNDGEESAAKKRKKKKCKSKAQVCADKCGTVTYKCHKKKRKVDCGSCICDVCASGCHFTAIQAAIDAADSGDTIRLCAETYTEAITIAKDLTIVGAAFGSFVLTVLRGTGDDRVVDVDAGTVSLKSLRITGGFGITDGGGIYNSEGATLLMTDCIVSGNTAEFGGGGIGNDGTLEMTDCTVSGNTAGEYGGGINNFFATLKLTGCTVTANTAPIDGGIHNFASTSTCTGGTSVSGNTPNDCGAKNGGSCDGC